MHLCLWLCAHFSNVSSRTSCMFLNTIFVHSCFHVISERGRGWPQGRGWKLTARRGGKELYISFGETCMKKWDMMRYAVQTQDEKAFQGHAPSPANGWQGPLIEKSIRPALNNCFPSSENQAFLEHVCLNFGKNLQKIYLRWTSPAWCFANI